MPEWVHVRRETRLDPTGRSRRLYGYRDFASTEAELARWLDDRAWTTGEGPRALFAGAVRLAAGAARAAPGPDALRRLVAGVREAATQRFWDMLAAKARPPRRASSTVY